MVCHVYYSSVDAKDPTNTAYLVTSLVYREMIRQQAWRRPLTLGFASSASVSED